MILRFMYRLCTQMRNVSWFQGILCFLSWIFGFFMNFSWYMRYLEMWVCRGVVSYAKFGVRLGVHFVKLIVDRPVTLTPSVPFDMGSRNKWRIIRYTSRVPSFIIIPYETDRSIIIILILTRAYICMYVHTMLYSV